MGNERPLRIMHLISTLDVGGAEQNLFRLATSMDGSAFRNYAVCMTRPGIFGKRLEQSGIPVYSLRMGKGIPDFRAAFRLRFLAGIVRPDIIQCWMYHANLLGLALLSPAKTLWNIRCSDMDLSQYGPVYRLAVKAGAKLSRIPSAVVANSYAGRDVHTKLGYHPKEWAVIPNGFDTVLFRPDTDARTRIRTELSIPQDAFVTGLICRLDPMKDHATFFEAADSFLASNPDARFILAGRGVNPASPSIRELLPRNSGRSRLHLLDERGDTAQIFASLDIATSSSAWGEGLPNAIGEAMAAGVPCAVTDVGDSGILVGDAGIVVPKKDPRALCAAWQRLQDIGPHERRKMGERARKRIIDGYSLASMVTRYEALYRRLMTGIAY